MRILLRAPLELTRVDGELCRRWEAVTGDGVPCHVFVKRVAVAREHEAAFEREMAGALNSTGVGDSPEGPSRPEPGRSISLRMLL